MPQASTGYFNDKSISYAGNAVSDLLQGYTTMQGDNIKSAGLTAESKNYTLASEYAGEEVSVAQTNQDIQNYQDIRNLHMAQGSTTSEVANADFQTSGSALDILASNAQQGAIQQAVTNIQGNNQVAGYQEQQQAYATLASSTADAAKKETELGTQSMITGGIGAAFNIAAAVVPGGK